MEGVYLLSNDSAPSVGDVFSDKARYLICSFSRAEALSNPLMWGHYANGFRGLAIEIEVPKADVRQVEYTRDLRREAWPPNIQDRVEKILTTKLSRWKHEHEFRYLKKIDRQVDGDNKSRASKIGNITAVYFGDPYGDAANSSSVFEKSSDLRAFRERREDLEYLAKEKDYYCDRVRVNDARVVRSE